MLAAAVIAAALLVAGCEKGEPDLAAVEPPPPVTGCEPETPMGSPPGPELSTPTASQCLRQMDACPPEKQPCPVRWILLTPQKALPVTKGEPLTLNFGDPVLIDEPEPLPRQKCKLTFTPTGNGTVWNLTMPAYVWSDSPRGCPAEPTFTGSLSVKYTFGDFEGYTAIFGFNIDIIREG